MLVRLTISSMYTLVHLTMNGNMAQANAVLAIISLFLARLGSRRRVSFANEHASDRPIIDGKTHLRTPCRIMPRPYRYPTAWSSRNQGTAANPYLLGNIIINTQALGFRLSLPDVGVFSNPALQRLSRNRKRSGPHPCDRSRTGCRAPYRSARMASKARLTGRWERG
jgi:hypothetical protein